MLSSISTDGGGGGVDLVTLDGIFPKFVRLHPGGSTSSTLRAEAEAIGLNKDFWHRLQNLSLQVNRSADASASARWWWSLRQAARDASPFDTWPSDGLQVALVVEKVPAGFFRSYLSLGGGVAGALAFYSGIVYLLGRLVRSAFRDTRYKVIYDEMPDVRDLVERLRAMESAPTVYVALPPPVYLEWSIWTTLKPLVNGALPRALGNAAKGGGARLVRRTFDAFAERCDTAAATCDWIDDGCHPNADGHRALAEAIADALDGACPRGRNSE